MAGGSKTAVYAAIGGNSLVMVAKFAAFAVTGSGTMLSEGIHSVADVSNQALLAFGISQSERGPDAQHPYGYGRARYIWALISAVGIFFLGCGVSVTHGISSLFGEAHEVSSLGWAAGVLLFALVVEGATLVIAYQTVRKQAQEAGQSFRTFFRSGEDPVGIAVLLEDGAAVLGVLLAGAALVLAHYTHDPRWDAVGSIVIGLLLGAVAIFLVNRNRSALLGESISPERLARLQAALAEDPAVESVSDVKATIMGAGNIRFKAEIEFHGDVLARKWLAQRSFEGVHVTLDSPEAVREYLVEYTSYVVDALGDEIDRIEEKIREVDPGVLHVDLETD